MIKYIHKKSFKMSLLIMPNRVKWTKTEGPDKVPNSYIKSTN